MSNQFREAYALGRGIIEPHKSLEDRFKDFDTMIEQVKADAWDEGFKQGGPMHDVNYDDPDAHTRNPYRKQEEA